MVQWGKNPPANAGDTGLIPGPGRWGATTSDAHAQSLCSPTGGATNSDAHAQSLCSPTGGATTSDAHMPRVCAPQQEEPQLVMPTHRVCAPQQEEPQLEMPTRLESVLPIKRSHCSEKTHAPQQRVASTG